MRRQLIGLTVAATVGLSGLSLVSANASDVSGAATSSKVTTLDNNAKSFDIANTRGGITITSGSAASVTSNATYTLTEPKVEVTTTNGTVFVKVTCTSLLEPVTDVLFPNDCKTNLVVTLPAAASVHASTDTAPLTVTKMAGELKLFTQTAPLTSGTGTIGIDTVSTPSLVIRSNAAPITAKKVFSQKFQALNSTGTIRVENSSLGETTVLSENGALSFTAVSASNASFQTGPGSATLRKISAGVVNVTTKTGVIDFTASTAPGLLTMTSDSAAISASVPRNTAYKVNAKSKTGKTTITNLVINNKVSRTITANSQSGSITIKGY